MSQNISKAELSVMEVLWAESPLGAGEVAERLPTDNAWNIRTVKTLLSRLTDKGVLSTRPDGRRYLYTPEVSRASYVSGAARRFTDRLFGGRAAPLVAHLAAGEGLSDEDIAELEALIAELKS